MKLLKAILGSVCLALAFLIGTAVSARFKFPTDLPLGIAGCWLAIVGGFLIVRCHTPMSKAGRIRLIFNLAFCGLMIFAGFPYFLGSRSTCCANACLNNLRQIDAAVNQFALENHLTNGAAIHFPDDLTPYIKLNSQGKIPSCPDGGIYHISRVGESPTCSLGTSITPAHVLP
jgi:hypothetical protein